MSALWHYKADRQKIAECHGNANGCGSFAPETRIAVKAPSNRALGVDSSGPITKPLAIILQGAGVR